MFDSPDIPPITSGPLPTRQSQWPNVVGIIAIVYASLMILCNGVGVFTPQMYEWFANMSAADGQVDRAMEISAEVYRTHYPLIIIMVLLAELAAIWLLVAAIALIRRRSHARKWFVAWACVELALAFLNHGLQFYFLWATTSAMEQESLSQQASEEWITTGIGSCFGFSIGVALPVFILIWMSRAKIKEEVMTWTSTSTPQ